MASDYEGHTSQMGDQDPQVTYNLKINPVVDLVLWGGGPPVSSCKELKLRDMLRLDL